MKYCRDTTLNHCLADKYPSAIELVNNLFSKEGGMHSLFGEDYALNLDEIERQRCLKEKISKQSTMDFAIGISAFGKSNCMLIVELKLEVKQPTNISTIEIDNKIKHSIELLGQVPAIHNKRVLIFKKNIKETAKNYFSRSKLRNLKQIEILSEQEFKEKYF